MGPTQIDRSGGSTAEAAAANDTYQAVRADDTIQFAPLKAEPPPEPPSWLGDFLEWLGQLLEPLGEFFGNSWPIVKWGLIGATACLALYLLWRLLKPVLDFRPSSAEEDISWVPKEEHAVALLEEADQLAAAGRYDEAAHLLLKRSVSQISAARPDLVDPSSTARELARSSALPANARSAFAVMTDRVERSLFALRRLGPDDWQTARDAYAQFALQRLTQDPA